MAISGRIGLVGGGNMGSALARGLVQSRAASREQIVVAEIDPERREALSKDLNLAVAVSPDVLSDLDLLIIAVKPPDVPAALGQARASLNQGALVISLAAGVRLATLAAALPEGQAIVRAMPNTPAFIGQGATAIAPNAHADEKHLALASEVFASVGLVVTVREELMDAVTGLSGSGPAYVFVFIEALADAGVRMGLERTTALTLAAQTVAGSANLLMNSGHPPAALKDMLTSPGGTTAAGLEQLEVAAFRGAVYRAVREATKRSKELGGD